MKEKIPSINESRQNRLASRQRQATCCDYRDIVRIRLERSQKMSYFSSARHQITARKMKKSY